MILKYSTTEHWSWALFCCSAKPTSPGQAHRGWEDVTRPHFIAKVLNSCTITEAWSPKLAAVVGPVQPGGFITLLQLWKGLP
jgi:hypothetical protein